MLGCPCINRSLPIIEGSNCSAVTYEGYVRCINPEYGFQCGAWDNGSPTCSHLFGDASHSICRQPWCYVNATVCRLSTVAMRKSQMRWKSDMMPQGLYYSYGACGAGTSLGNLQHLSSLANFKRRPLRIAMPSFGQEPIHYKLGPSGKPMTAVTSPLFESIYTNDSIPWHGSMPDFLRRLESKAREIEGENISFELTFTSRGTRAQHRNPFTAAVAEVGAGLADVAGSCMWVTPERLEKAPFSVSLLNDDFYLFIPKELGATTADDFAHNVWKAFAPFHYSLWLMTLGIIVLMGTVESYLMGKLNAALRTPGGRKARLLALSNAMQTGIYNSALGFVSQDAALLQGEEREVEKVTGAMRLLRVAYGLFILITLGSYTANLAGVLLEAKKTDGITTLNRAAEREMPVCADQVLSSELRAMYPQVSLKFGNLLNPAGIEEAVSQHGCELMIVSMRVFITNEEADTWRCNNEYVAVGPPVYSRRSSMAASQDVVQGISLLVERLYSDEHEDYMSDFEKPRSHTAVCPRNALSNKQVADQALYPSQLIGVLVVVAAAVVGALACEQPKKILTNARHDLGEVIGQGTASIAMTVSNCAHMDV